MTSHFFAFDDASSLLKALQTDPTGETVNVFVASIAEETSKDPTNADTIAKTLKSLLLDHEEARSLLIKGIDEDPTSTAPFPYTFLIALGEWLNYALHETSLVEPKYTKIDPSNTVLIASIFSASLVKAGVLDSPSYLYSFTRQGLGLPGSAYEEERRETVAIGACLQLHIAGKIMVERWLEASDGVDTVIMALNTLQKDAVIQFENGKALLQNTIILAEQGFSKSSTVEDAWLTLFPENGTYCSSVSESD